MQVNNKNRNENIQGDKSQTKPDQKIESSEDSKRKKPSLHQKEKKYLSAQPGTEQSHSETLPPESGKQAMNRFNMINSHFQFKDAFTDVNVVSITKDK